MKKLKLFFAFTLFFSLLISSCKYGSGNVFYKYNNVDNRVNSIKDLGDVGSVVGITGSNQPYSFMILTDIHFGSIRGGNNPLPLDEFWAWVQTNHTNPDFPKFCFILGDNIDWCDEGFLSEYLAFRNKLENDYGLKTFNIIGNHDMYQEGWEMWRDNNYPGTSFYRFVIDGVSYYALDSATGTFGKKQKKILENEFLKDTNPKIILSHYPIHTNFFYVTFDDTTERNYFVSLFNKNNVKAYFNGHIHKIEESNLGNFNEYSCPSMRFRQKWTIVSVDPSTKEVSLNFIGK